jgi:hypothetical protein
VGEERVLLRTREAVDLVHEQDGPHPVLVATLRREGHRLAQVFHTRIDGRQGGKMCALARGEQPSEGRLPGPWGPPQQQGWESPTPCKPCEQLSGCEQVFLTHELVQRHRPHSLGERLIYAPFLGATLEQIHDTCARYGRT